ncbi:MAG TPA: SGNH/GDSL hydrolase family protein [Balneolaceae bacterium]|nr:SGNH/GDSL hydrolase family protein [Balneolaceae bacterium]
MKCVLLLSSLLAVFIYSSKAQKTNKQLYVLFIGNSYTYYNSMPQLFKAMAENQFPGLQVQVKFVGKGGATLKEHWERSRAPHEIRSGSWDYVVLQEQSALGSAFTKDGKQYIGRPDQFFAYARKFVGLIKQNNAKAVFYMTWARKRHPDEQKYLSYAYMKIAQGLNSKIAPIGMVWDSLRTNNTVNLYQKYGSHPSVQGSYLAALMLFATIFDTPPTGIPGLLKGHKILRGGKLAKEESVLCNLAHQKMEVLQHAAAEMFDRLKQNGGYLKVEQAVSKKRTSFAAYLLRKIGTAQGQTFLLIIAGLIFLVISSRKKLSLLFTSMPQSE